MPSAARIGDPISCSDHVAQGSSDVFFDNLPAARIGDPTTGHGCFPETRLAEGNSSEVFANGILISLVGNHNVSHRCGITSHNGALTECSPTVFIGG